MAETSSEVTHNPRYFPKHMAETSSEVTTARIDKSHTRKNVPYPATISELCSGFYEVEYEPTVSKSTQGTPGMRYAWRALEYLKPPENIKVKDNIRAELTQAWQNALDGKCDDAIHNYKTCSTLFACLPGEQHEHKDAAHICLFTLMHFSTTYSGNDMSRLYKKLEHIDPRTTPYIHYISFLQADEKQSIDYFMKIRRCINERGATNTHWCSVYYPLSKQALPQSTRDFVATEMDNFKNVLTVKYGRNFIQKCMLSNCKISHELICVQDTDSPVVPSSLSYNALECDEKCIVYYHSDCFKSAPKWNIDDKCVTPDCGGSVIILWENGDVKRETKNKRERKESHKDSKGKTTKEVSHEKGGWKSKNRKRTETETSGDDESGRRQRNGSARKGEASTSEEVDEQPRTPSPAPPPPPSAVTPPEKEEYVPTGDDIIEMFGTMVIFLTEYDGTHITDMVMKMSYLFPWVKVENLYDVIDKGVQSLAINQSGCLFIVPGTEAEREKSKESDITKLITIYKDTAQTAALKQALDPDKSSLEQHPDLEKGETRKLSPDIPEFIPKQRTIPASPRVDPPAASFVAPPGVATLGAYLDLERDAMLLEESKRRVSLQEEEYYRQFPVPGAPPLMIPMYKGGPQIGAPIMPGIPLPLNQLHPRPGSLNPAAQEFNIESVTPKGSATVDVRKLTKNITGSQESNGELEEGELVDVSCNVVPRSPDKTGLSYSERKAMAERISQLEQGMENIKARYDKEVTHYKTQLCDQMDEFTKLRTKAKRLKQDYKIVTDQLTDQTRLQDEHDRLKKQIDEERKQWLNERESKSSGAKKIMAKLNIELDQRNREKDEAKSQIIQRTRENEELINKVEELERQIRTKQDDEMDVRKEMIEYSQQYKIAQQQIVQERLTNAQMRLRIAYANCQAQITERSLLQGDYRLTDWRLCQERIRETIDMNNAKYQEYVNMMHSSGVSQEILQFEQEPPCPARGEADILPLQRYDDIFLGREAPALPKVWPPKPENNVITDAFLTNLMNESIKMRPIVSTPAPSATHHVPHFDFTDTPHSEPSTSFSRAPNSLSTNDYGLPSAPTPPNPRPPSITPPAPRPTSISPPNPNPPSMTSPNIHPPSMTSPNIHPPSMTSFNPNPPSMTSPNIHPPLMTPLNPRPPSITSHNGHPESQHSSVGSSHSPRPYFDESPTLQPTFDIGELPVTRGRGGRGRGNRTRSTSAQPSPVGVVTTNEPPPPNKGKMIKNTLKQNHPHLSESEINQYLFKVREENKTLHRVTKDFIIQRVGEMVEADNVRMGRTPRRSSSSTPDCCVICYEAYDTAPKGQLGCGHEFHDHCINLWFATNNHTCPTCRSHQPSVADFPPLGH